MEGVTPNSRFISLAVRQEQVRNPMAQQYASQYGVETVGATEDLFWNSYHLVGILAPIDPPESRFNAGL